MSVAAGSRLACSAAGTKRRRDVKSGADEALDEEGDEDEDDDEEIFTR